MQLSQCMQHSSYAVIFFVYHLLNKKFMIIHMFQRKLSASFIIKESGKYYFYLNTSHFVTHL